MGRKLAAILEREHIDGRTVVGFLDESELVAGDVLGRVKTLPASRAANSWTKSSWRFLTGMTWRSGWSAKRAATG